MKDFIKEIQKILEDKTKKHIEIKVNFLAGVFRVSFIGESKFLCENTFEYLQIYFESTDDGNWKIPYLELTYLGELEHDISLKEAKEIILDSIGTEKSNLIFENLE